MLDVFLKSYWSYYIELESQFIETKRYVEFSTDNQKTYSVEYLKLYQAVCSEIDVVGKEIAQRVNPNFTVDTRTNIQKWGYELQQQFGNIKDLRVSFIGEQTLQPFLNWEYETYTDRGGSHKIRLANGVTNVIPWWRNYNKVKHQRIGLVTGTQNFPLANQFNLILSLSALFLMETLFISFLETEEHQTAERDRSKLFSIQQP
ncbi:hypothetical protein [Ruminococcus champanellensis]|uniref:hypothetical protein n=1 Tax=Ruminococcus champanellensis TaxID=1161942 RepID=UPI002060212A|nr:hypothetical protein [Ruminococcus champanellensis]MED9891319.1 hypothetical protein [Ruminococcus champanellensis]DAL70436.1 MAG TPA: hypothetical protein [Caudoviricetes sp.]